MQHLVLQKLIRKTVSTDMRKPCCKLVKACLLNIKIGSVLEKINLLQKPVVLSSFDASSITCRIWVQIDNIFSFAVQCICQGTGMLRSVPWPMCIFTIVHFFHACTKVNVGVQLRENVCHTTVLYVGIEHAPGYMYYCFLCKYCINWSWNGAYIVKWHGCL